MQRFLKRNHLIFNKSEVVMIKILANDGIEADGKKMLEAAGFTVQTDSIPQAELMTRLQEFDAIIVRSATQVRKELIDACPKLRVIARGGVGMDNIDVAYASEKGLEVINTPAASSQSVAELAMAHLFSLARFLQQANREMATGDFKKLKKNYSEGIQLRGRTLGIVGFGRIGQELARLALGCGMKVIAHDPFLKSVKLSIDIAHRQIPITVKIQTLKKVLENSDVLSLHVPNLGKPLLGKAEMKKMKRGSIVLNCSRGGVIDEDALLAALESGQIGGAGLDVFVGEPNPRADLLRHPKVSVTPHIGASTVEAQAKIGQELAEKITAYFKK